MKQGLHLLTTLKDLSFVSKFMSPCRCIPTLPADVQAKVSVSTSGINSFYNTASTRLRRYLADIGKAKWLIIVSGKTS